MSQDASKSADLGTSWVGVAKSGSEPVLVINGAGPVGCAAGIQLKQTKQFAHYKVVLIEARSRDDLTWTQDVEMAKVTQTNAELGAGAKRLNENNVMGNVLDAKARSINLALSHRGIECLKKIDCYDGVKDDLIPMRGRYMHAVDGATSIMPYGKGHQAIYSISRGRLNDYLRSCAEEHGVEIRWNLKVSGVKKVKETGRIRVSLIHQISKDKIDLDADRVLGCDGAWSKTRASMMRMGRYDLDQSYHPAGYKEVHFSADENGKHRLETNYLHVWARGPFMLIALPNCDGTFTGTIFMNHDAPEPCFKSIKTDEQIKAFYAKYFPDVPALVPDYVEQYKNNPTSPLASITVSPWHYEDKMLLLGDAAHPVCPFYGQGLNCGLEDVLWLSEYLESSSSIGEAFAQMSEHRQPSAAGLRELSLQNFVEMADLSGRKSFLWKKKLEAVLQCVPGLNWVPLYTMVSFTRTPYHEAIEKAERQDRYLGYTSTALGAAAMGLAGYAAWHYRDRIVSKFS